jgi:uncharacterized protein (DUF2384 family)
MRCYPNAAYILPNYANRVYFILIKQSAVQFAGRHSINTNTAFGSEENFHTWMETKSIPLGGVKPKGLLDTTYGINLITDELGRIEHGIFA